MYDRTLSLYLVEHGDRPGPRAVARPGRDRRSARTSTGTTRSRGRCLRTAGRRTPMRRCGPRSAFGTRDAKLLYHAGMIAAAVGDASRARTQLSDALALDAELRSGGCASALAIPWRHCHETTTRSPASRVATVAAAARARHRQRAPARQLHDQPPRGDPRRAGPGAPRRRHRPGGDPRLPGTPPVRHRRRRPAERRRDRRGPAGRLRLAPAGAPPGRRRHGRAVDPDLGGSLVPAGRRRPLDAPAGVRARGPAGRADHGGDADRLPGHLVPGADRLARDRGQRLVDDPRRHPGDRALDEPVRPAHLVSEGPDRGSPRRPVDRAHRDARGRRARTGRVRRRDAGRCAREGAGSTGRHVSAPAAPAASVAPAVAWFGAGRRYGRRAALDLRQRRPHAGRAAALAADRGRPRALPTRSRRATARP